MRQRKSPDMKRLSTPNSIDLDMSAWSDELDDRKMVRKVNYSQRAPVRGASPLGFGVGSPLSTTIISSNGSIVSSSNGSTGTPVKLLVRIEGPASISDQNREAPAATSIRGEGLNLDLYDDISHILNGDKSRATFHYNDVEDSSMFLNGDNYLSENSTSSSNPGKLFIEAHFIKPTMNFNMKPTAKKQPPQYIGDISGGNTKTLYATNQESSNNRARFKQFDFTIPEEGDESADGERAFTAPSNRSIPPGPRWGLDNKQYLEKRQKFLEGRNERRLRKSRFSPSLSILRELLKDKSDNPTQFTVPFGSRIDDDDEELTKLIHSRSQKDYVDISKVESPYSFSSAPQYDSYESHGIKMNRSITSMLNDGL